MSENAKISYYGECFAEEKIIAVVNEFVASAPALSGQRFSEREAHRPGLGHILP